MTTSPGALSSFTRRPASHHTAASEVRPRAYVWRVYGAAYPGESRPVVATFDTYDDARAFVGSFGHICAVIGGAR